ncbi:MAG TPA: polysaccharide biosynthesis tyrosine autokinase [Bacteroidales bacterium]|nr:polysaccharide biosynthesis tyrosine autokinase [Bacteroidales bacterium]
MTGNNPKRIPELNEELDFKLLYHITKRNILFQVILLALAIAGSFLYLRYTPSVYSTSAIIQLGTDEHMNQLLTPVFFRHEDEMAQKTELIRSSVFQQRVLSKLPLHVGYFNRGRVLNFELYTKSPFRVEASVKNPQIYGLQINIEFLRNNKVGIHYNKNGNTPTRKEFSIGETVNLPDLDLKVELIYPDPTEEQLNELIRNNYFFVLHNPSKLYANYSATLKVNVLNASARTIIISKTGNNPAKISDIVNAMASEFNLYDMEVKTASSDKILEFIERQLGLVFDQLTQSELELERFKRAHNLDQTTTTPLSSVHARIEDFENQIVSLQMEERLLSEIERVIADDSNIDVFRFLAVLSGSDHHATISGLLLTLQNQLLEREKLLYEVTPNSRQVDALNFQINIQKRMLKESVVSVKNNIRLQIAGLESRIDEFESVLSERSDRANHSELNRLQRIFNINERFYNQLVEKKAEHSISRAGLVTQNILLESSVPPARPIAPLPNTIYLASLLAAGLLGLGIILLKYLFYNKIHSINEIFKYTRTPVLGIIPRHKGEIEENQILVIKKPKSIIAESLRSVRTNLQFIDNTPGAKLIAVTSTVSGEGKTFFALNLAGVLAFSEKKVVVIDLDMRKPNIHKRFKVENTSGVSTILSGIHKIEDCINKSQIKNLDFISAGPVPPNPSELILTPNMDKMLAFLKSNYDFVIVDNPPVGIVTDGMKSILLADYPVYIFKANYSSRIFIDNVNRLVAENNVKNLSIVLNCVDPEFSSYGFGKGYGFYSEFDSGYYDEPLTRPSNKPAFTGFFSKYFKKKNDF